MKVAETIQLTDNTARLIRSEIVHNLSSSLSIVLVAAKIHAATSSVDANQAPCWYFPLTASFGRIQTLQAKLKHYSRLLTSDRFPYPSIRSSNDIRV